MARIVIDRARLQRAFQGDGMRQAVHNTAGKVQDEAVRLNATELVDTGLMTASWRIADRPSPHGWIARVHNTARSEEGANYPLYHEYGFRHHRSGRHIAGRHILARSIDAARH